MELILPKFDKNRKKKRKIRIKKKSCSEVEEARSTVNQGWLWVRGLWKPIGSGIGSWFIKNCLESFVSLLL